LKRSVEIEKFEVDRFGNQAAYIKRAHATSNINHDIIHD